MTPTVRLERCVARSRLGPIREGLAVALIAAGGYMYGGWRWGVVGLLAGALLVWAARSRLGRTYFPSDGERFHPEFLAGLVAAVVARLEILETLPLLDATGPAVELTGKLLDRGAVPRNAADDAAHIAVAAANGVDYLVTWNFRHIANATMRSRIEDVCRRSGYGPPVICTPSELVETRHARDADRPDHR